MPTDFKKKTRGFWAERVEQHFPASLGCLSRALCLLARTLGWVVSGFFVRKIRFFVILLSTLLRGLDEWIRSQ